MKFRRPRRNRRVEVSITVDPRDDPASPRVRLHMARKLVVDAIRRYEETLAACRWTDAAYPKLSQPAEPSDVDGREERAAWSRLISQVDDDFNNAELALASRIQCLYDDLAPDGKKAVRTTLGHFTERAVRFEGTTYALQYAIEDYEPGSCIIAIVRDAVAFDLDSEE